MQKVKAEDADVAKAVGKDRSTISRIRRGVVRPDADTLLKLSAWAERAARRKRLPRAQWLTWNHLFAGPSRRERKSA